MRTTLRSAGVARRAAEELRSCGEGAAAAPAARRGTAGTRTPPQRMLGAKDMVA